MFITKADVVQIREAYAKLGREAALSELRRRLPVYVESSAAAALRRILACPVAPPPPWRGEAGETLSVVRGRPPERPTPERTGGRPQVMTAELLSHVQKLLAADPSSTIAGVCRQLGAAPSTVSAFLNPNGSLKPAGRRRMAAGERKASDPGEGSPEPAGS